MFPRSARFSFLFAGYLFAGTLPDCAAQIKGGGAPVSTSLLWEVGSLNPDERTEFTKISYVVPLPGDGVAVADRQAHRVFIYDRDGKAVRAWGRKGGGPAEFQSIDGVGSVADTIWLIDTSRLRISFFELGGTLLRTDPIIPIRMTHPWGSVIANTRLANGHVVSAPHLDGSMLGSTASKSIPLIVGTLSGQFVQQLSVFDAGNPGFRLPTASGETVITHPGLRSLSRRFLWGASPDGQAVMTVSQDERSRILKVRIFHTGGGQRDYQLQYNPVPVESSMIDRLIAEVARSASPRPQDQRSVEQQIRKSATIPRHYPGAANALLSNDGLVWLQDVGLDRRRSNWILLDLATGLVQRYQFPPGHRVVAGTRTRVYTAQSDQFGIEKLSAFRR